MRLDGHTYAQIGETFGVSRQRIQQLIAPPKAIRMFVVERTEGRCEVCELLVGHSGHVHHIGESGPDNYNDVDRLMLLCIGCHRRMHPTLGETKNQPKPVKAIKEPKERRRTPAERIMGYMNADPGKSSFTVTELCRIPRLTLSIYKWIAEGSLPARRVMQQGLSIWVIDKYEVEAHIKLEHEGYIKPADLEKHG
jgi:hypothetical protein